MFEASWLFLLILVSIGIGTQLKKARMDVFEPVFVSSIAYGLFFLVPLLIFWLEPAVYYFDPQLAEEQLARVTLAVMLFFTAQLLGHKAAGVTRILRSEMRWQQLPWSCQQLAMSAAVMYAIAWAARLVVIAEGQYFQSTRAEVTNIFLTSYAKSIEELYLVALVLLGASCLVATGPLRARLRRAFFVACALEILVALPSGRKETVMLIPLLLLYLYNQYAPCLSRRSLFIWSVPACLATSAYFVINQTYRLGLELTFPSVDTGDLTTIEGMTGLVSQSIAVIETFGTELFTIAVTQSLSRLGGAVEPMFSIFHLTPNVVPHKLGASYNLLLEIVPRAIWPDKPVTSLNNLIGREYGLVSNDDLATAVLIGVPGEAYMNFGYLGLVLAGFCVGYILTRTYRVFLNRWSNPISIALYFPFLLVGLIRIQSGLVGSIFGAIKLTAFAFVIIYVVSEATRVYQMRLVVGSR